MLKGFLRKKCTAIVTVFTLSVTSLTGQWVSVDAASVSKTPYTIQLKQNGNNNQTGSAKLASQMKDGAILHAWCWSFNTIKSNMEDIAKAGYTSIQTSPASACVVGNNGDKHFRDQWWYHYQPTDYTLGNYQVGSADEFKAMCDEADKYGIRIIVDVVANHCTSNYNAISNNIKSKSNFFHTNQEVGDWNSRYEVTQKALLGLWDNNTQNWEVQNYIKDYLKYCVQLGADGFRYDAAKHIELPDDSGFGGDFWPNVLNNGAQFQYGEILQDSISREGSYSNYMSVTGSSYGKKMRDAIGSNHFNAGNVMNYNIGVDPDKVVTWVESHDNYANGINDWGSSQWMNDEQIKLCWAAICARKEGTPLFFSRPVGGGGKSWDNRFPEITKMGDRGSSLFMDDEVVAVNKFRNVMGNTNENMKNPNGDSKVLMIERGDKGIVLINLHHNNYELSASTSLKQGSYTNRTDNNNTYQVSSGRITGKLPARSVVVLYNGFEQGPSVDISNYMKSFKTDSYRLTLNCSGAEHATYSVNGGQSYLYENENTLVIGSGDPFDTVYRIELRAVNKEGMTITKTFVIQKKDPNSCTTIYFEKPSSWGNDIYVYLYDKEGTSGNQNVAWPGEKMEKNSQGRYVYCYSNEMNTPRIIFTDGNQQVPGASQEGFEVTDNGCYDENGFCQVVEPTPSIIPTQSPTPTPSIIPTQSPTPTPSIIPTQSPTSTPSIVPTPTVSPIVTDACVYFTKPAGWGNDVYAYVYREEGSSVIKNAKWPGELMTQESSGEFKYRKNDYKETDKIIFTDGSHQTPGSGQAGFDVVKDGHYTENGLTMGEQSITIYYKSEWTNTNIHYQIGNGEWTQVPGVSMINTDISGYKVITISLGTENTFCACFNNGNGKWDNHSGNNFVFHAGGIYTITNGMISNGVPN